MIYTGYDKNVNEYWSQSINRYRNFQQNKSVMPENLPGNNCFWGKCCITGNRGDGKLAQKYLFCKHSFKCFIN